MMPHGVLFRGGAEGAIRECLLEPTCSTRSSASRPNLFYSTCIPACY